jgi:GT2 family glycosyltransferase
MFVLPSASLISRAAFDAIGGFDERLCGYEDDDLFLRLFRAGYHNVYIDEALSQWRITGNTASYTPAMGRSRLIYASKLIAEYPEHVHSVIVPRFMRSISGDAQRHIKARNNAAMRKAIEDAKCFAAYLPVRRRIRLRLADTLFRHWRIGRVLRARRFIRA